MDTNQVHKLYLKVGSEWISKYRFGDVYVDHYEAQRSYEYKKDAKVKLEIVKINKYFVQYTLNESSVIHRETITSFINDNKPNQKVDYGNVTMGVRLIEIPSRGKKIPVIAKTDLYGIVKKGDQLFVQSILYTEDTVIHFGMALHFLKDAPKKCHLDYLPSSLIDKPLGTVIEFESTRYSNNEGRMAMVSMLPVIATVGSYKSGVIITKDGKEYPSSILLGNKSFGDVFEKN